MPEDVIGYLWELCPNTNKTGQTLLFQQFFAIRANYKQSSTYHYQNLQSF